MQKFEILPTVGERQDQDNSKDSLLGIDWKERYDKS